MAELKIVSYNICDSIDEKNISDNIVNFANDGVNFFCLQEVRPAKEGKFIGDILLEKLGNEWQSEFFLSSDPTNSDYGLAMLWRKNAIESVRFQTLSFSKLNVLNLFEQLIEFAKGKKTQPIQRGSIIGTFIFAGKKVRITNVHLDWHGGMDHRIRQLERLVKYLKKEPAVDSEIICGDFNTVSFLGTNSQMQRIQSLLGKEFFNSIPEFQRTTTFYQHLDHIFARNMKLQQAKIKEVVGSDHFPIVASLTI